MASSTDSVQIGTYGSVSQKDSAKAAAALKKWKEGQKSEDDKAQLFEDATDDYILQVNLRKMPEKKRLKPVMLPLKHTMHQAEEGARLCLFVKDPAEDVVQKLEEQPVPGFVKVIGYTKLSKNYKQYSARRELLKSYDAFFVDDRILPMMPRVLGKTFFARKRQPVPVAMSGSRSLTNALQRARDSTPLYLGAGLCLAIKVGHTGMTPAQVAENVMAVLPEVIDQTPRKWRNIASVHMKLPESAALPLFMALAHDEVAAAVAAGVTVPTGGAAAAHGAAGAGGDAEDDPVVGKIQWDEGATPAKKGKGAVAASTGKRGAKRARSAVKAERDTEAVVGGSTPSAKRVASAAGKRYTGSAKKTPGRATRGSK